MTETTTAYRSTMRTERDGFGQLLHSEWTKFRTVRGWVIATVVAALVTVLFGLLTAAGSHTSCSNGPVEIDCPAIPVGPGGEAVKDSFYFVHQPLAGDGSITVRVTSLTGGVVARDGGVVRKLDATTPTSGAIQPWAKAGLIIKENTTQGSAYAAIMVTGGHGVRMQDNYTGDAAGPAGAVSAASPRWLRLTRTGNTLTGYSSIDGAAWTAVGTAHLAGLSTTVQAGMFATSPIQETFTQQLGGGSATGGPTLATARFDTLGLQGHWPEKAWTGDAVGAEPGRAASGELRQSGATYAVAGTGDIAPDVAGSGATIEQTLAGVFATLAMMVVLGVLFITTEYRRGMIRTSLTARPRRGQILAAKAMVIGAVTFVTGLIANAVTFPLTAHFLRANGNFIYPTTWLTALRVIAGTAALLAVAAVLALAVGTIVRRSAGAVAAVIVLIVLPYIVSTAGVLPAGPSQWLLRLTPAAGFAIQQSLIEYPQVSHAYAPAFGFYPLVPWSGFAVLCAYAAVALGVAHYLLQRRDT